MSSSTWAFGLVPALASVVGSRWMTPHAWKQYYAKERGELGERGLDALLTRAPNVDLVSAKAWVFPHTRLSTSGTLVASLARAVVESRVDRVLAIGVLHGHHDGDRDSLRAVHGLGAPFDRGVTQYEFSLDGFIALVEAAARRAGQEPPEIVARFPFLVGDEPASLPGLDELVLLRDQGVPVVATADPVHHGVGYGTPRAECLPREGSASVTFARDCIDAQLSALSRHDFSDFRERASRCRSDFRDAGPILAELVGKGFRSSIHELLLVDYHDVFAVDEPTWVAGATVSLHC